MASYEVDHARLELVAAVVCANVQFCELLDLINDEIDPRKEEQDPCGRARHLLTEATKEAMAACVSRGAVKRDPGP